ncbi:MAG: integrase arm-type DNA-binding domain-containing protein, partial [Alphaproteobacteria bacterium]|nr:integrase arm-type DNA-binding domain-containing protein [Alphaproteobacteria bacterium]
MAGRKRKKNKRIEFDDDMFDSNPRKRKEYFDKEVHGLGARQGIEGQAAYFYSYLVVQNDGKKKHRRHTFGKFPEMKTERARLEAARLKTLVRAGGDPEQDKQVAKANPVVEQAPRTVADALDLYFKAVVYDKDDGHKNPDATRKFYRRYFGGWYERPIAEITEADANALLTRIKVDRGRVAANRAFTRGRVFFKWAAHRKQRYIGQNPFADIEKPGGKEEPRDRNLFDDVVDGSPELISVWKAADQIGYPYGPLVKLMILLGQRRDEITGMRWAEL